MCRCMGSHFHHWIDYNGVTRMGSHIFCFWGMTVLYLYGWETYRENVGTSAIEKGTDFYRQTTKMQNNINTRPKVSVYFKFHYFSQFSWTSAS